MTNKKQLTETYIGFAVIALVLILGFTKVLTETAFVRALIGMGFGYALIRGDFGFAGLANRTFRKGNTKLIRSLMLLFTVSAIITGALLLSGELPVGANLWVNPISWGLLVGGILFGIGMTFSSCCASGVLQDVPMGFSRAITTLIFFGIGVFLGFPVMKTAFVKTTIFSTSSYADTGVFLPDFFGYTIGEPMTIYPIVGAILLTALIAGLIAWGAKWYENKVADKFPKEVKEETKTDSTVFEKLFVNQWSHGVTLMVIAMLFGVLLMLTDNGWGVSTIYGKWFGNFLMIFGVSAEQLASFTGKPAGLFEAGIFTHPVSVQNIGIIVGAVLALLLAGKFNETFKAGLKIQPAEIALFAVGGLLMGLGTRFSMGCNVGALYTPIANFSLAGWFYFFFLVAGGYIGHKVYTWFYTNIAK